MYIKDDVCYASEPVDEIKVNQVKPLQGRMLLVTFNTGERKLYDTTLLKGSAFCRLNEEDVFMNPVLFRGIITWDDGSIDIAPETVYADSIAYEEDYDF